MQAGARIDVDPRKEHPMDFALWKAAKPGEPSWASPWGPGRPGWHIECSAMSMKFLGKQLDIHCGGIDHVDIHHTNEIAQSEAATGRRFFNFWMHGAFLNIQGGKKMAKSEENFLTLENALIQRGIPPLAYRFASFLTHYRKPMEYSDESIQAAKNGLEHLCNQVREVSKGGEASAGAANSAFREKFLEAVNDDLNLPRAMAVIQEMLKSDIPSSEKHTTILDFDRVLGLSLDQVDKPQELPAEIQKRVEARRRAREAKNWAESDRLRDEIQALGYTVKDTRDGMKLLKS
jgi:cysteinyl-tRNA synthetase